MKITSLIGYFAVLASLMFAGARPASAAPAPAKYALLVGITDYSRDGLSKLDGCLNDVRDMRQELIDDFGFKPENIRVVTNQDATRGGIVKAFRAQLHDNAAKDPKGTYLFYYSGHGFQAPDHNGDEKLEDPDDTKDETFMAWDVDLIDDDVDILCRETRGVPNFTGSLTVILDSCHSGTATRGAVKDGKPNVKSAQATYEPAISEPLTEIKTKGNGNPNAGNFVAFSGCLSTQSSEEKLFPVVTKAGEKGATKNEYHGVLTYYLLQAMKTATKSTSNSQMWTQVATVLSGKYDQLPLLEGERPNAPFLGGANRATVPPIPYTLAGDSLTFPKGVEAGAVKGGFIKVSSAGQSDKQLAITTAELGKASATLPKDTTVGANGTVELLTPYFGSEPLKVGLGAGIAADNPVAALLQEHYAGDKSGFVKLAVADETPNVFLLRATRGQALPTFKATETEKLDDAGYMVSKAPGGQAIFNVWLSASEGDNIAATQQTRLFETLDNYAAQSNVKTLSNQIESGLTATQAVKVTAYAVKGKTDSRGKWNADPTDKTGQVVELSKRKLNVDEGVRFEFQNQTSLPLYVSVVWLSGDGSITVLQDTKKRKQIVLTEQGKAEDNARTFNYGISGPAGEETIKFFVSRQPIDVDYLERDAIRKEGARGALSPFDLIAGQMMGTRAPNPDFDQPEFGSWDTISLFLSIGDPEGKGKGFIDVSK